MSGDTPLKNHYRRLLAEVGSTANTLSRRYPLRAVSVERARDLVDDVLDAYPDEGRDDLAALLARALAGEAAYLELTRTRADPLTGRRVLKPTDEAIIRADRDLKRAGVRSKGDRNLQLAEQFGLKPDTVRKKTKKLARGRPKKQP